MRQNRRNSGSIRFVVRRIYRALLREIVYGDSVDLNGRIGKLGYTEHGPRWRRLSKILGENTVNLIITFHVFQVDLGINNMLQIQPRAFDDRPDVIEGLPALFRESAR